jgi:hypothetical protein
MENGYGSGPRQLKGAYVVEKVDEKIKKAMQAKPEQFGFGIVKPSRWDGKKPRVVLLCKEAKLAGLVEQKTAPAYREPTPEERQRDEFIRRHVETAYYGFALEKLAFDKADLLALLRDQWEDEWRRRPLMPILEAADVQSSDAEQAAFPDEALEKKSRDTLLQLVIFSLLSGNSDQMAALLEHKKAKVQECVKKAQAEAIKAWNEKQQKAA